MNPTIFLTNWSSKFLHGPGRKLTIMRSPRSWEHGEGRVVALLPRRVDLIAVQAGQITSEEYNARCFEHFTSMPAHLSPGKLYTTAEGGTPVREGDTLCCKCSKADAKAGKCHRVVAAQVLRSAGWRVVLDGEVFHG